MLAGQMSNAEVAVMNEEIWPGLNDTYNLAACGAACPTRANAINAVLNNKEAKTQQLRDLGTTVIGPDEGLDPDAFRAALDASGVERLGSEDGARYAKVAATS